MEKDRAVVAYECEEFKCMHYDELSEFCNERSRNYPAGLCRRCKYGTKCENCARIEKCERGKSLFEKQNKWNEIKFDPDEVHKIANKKCKTCKYGTAASGTGVCDYNIKTLKMRNAPVGYCSTWEPKEKKHGGRPKGTKTKQEPEVDRKVKELQEAITKRKDEEKKKMAQKKQEVAPVQQNKMPKAVKEAIIKAMTEKQDEIEKLQEKIKEQAEDLDEMGTYVGMQGEI